MKIFGGNGNRLIVRLGEFFWSRIGLLSREREMHNVIEVQGEILVIGGLGEYTTERCSHTNITMDCTQQEPSLNGYHTYPELFIVPDNYCQVDNNSNYQ